MNKITKDMTIGEVITKFPKTAEVLMGKGIHCIGCHVAVEETLEQGLKAHGKDGKEVDKIIAEMNKAAK
ncbi:DUF1858 domain-containing protein [Candidatus Woesearchaeota archaeon]|nr:DUF1858 domain-containing protein [Candidatus Woesearchaeota archaeon]